MWGSVREAMFAIAALREQKRRAARSTFARRTDDKVGKGYV